MKELLEIFKNMYDIIIIDAPPCKLVTDSIILSTIVDSSILVASSENTKMKEFNEVKKSIQMVGGEIIGAILNKKKLVGKTYRKGYYYGHTETKEIEEIQETQTISVDAIIKQATKNLKKNEKEEQEISETKEVVQDKEEKNNYEEIKKFMTIQLKELQKSYYQLAEDVKSNEYKEAFLKKIEEEKLNKEKIENIYNEMKENFEQTRLNTSEMINEVIKETFEQNKLNTSEMINKVIKQNTEELLKEIKKGEDSEQAMQLLLNERIAQMQEETQNLVQQEITKINYTRQMEEMNEMLTNLKDSYLELSNKMKNNEVNETAKEEVTENPEKTKKIIDFRAFKKQKNKTKKVYSIEEDISYEDLEQSAAYIIPLQKIERYEKTM